MSETTAAPMQMTPLAPGQLPLHPRMHFVWALSHGFWFSLLLAAVAVPLLVRFTGMPILAALLLALAAGVCLGWTYTGRYAAHYSAVYLADGVLIRRGVWWRSELFVPRARIQHTEINQGPLDRRWNMAGVRIHAAGTHLESIPLAGVPLAVAVQLRDALLDRRTHADGA